MFYYVATYLAACAVAVALFAQSPESFSFYSSGYRRFISAPWKVATFIIAMTGLTLMAPYTGDPTWDYVDSVFMSAFTYLGAPWVVGTLYQTARGSATLRQAYVAACIWMFSASWSYDLYILLKTGLYPDTWLENISASSVLFLSAGLLWNLDWRPATGSHFAFTRTDWPNAPDGPVFGRIAWIATPIMAIIALLLARFLWP